MVQIPKINIDPYIDAAFRRKWWIILPALLALVCGAVYAKITPRIYLANTLILVEPQRVPTSYVRPTVTQSVAGRLQTISQQVNSRTNLERIIRDFKLMESADVEKESPAGAFKAKLSEFLQPKPGDGSALENRLPWIGKAKKKLRELLAIEAEKEKNKKPSMLAMVEALRQKINISIRGGRTGASAFEISFEWQDPKVAASVTNAVASQFIEQNLQVREEMAIGTTAFLNNEAERIRHQLETKELAVEKFKKLHMGMLPDQMESNLNILGQLKEELNSLEKRIELEKQQALMLQNQQNSMGSMNFGFLDSFSDGNTMGDPVVAELEAKLESLLTRYTEKHPDVIRLRRQIEKAENAAKNSSDATSRELPADLGMSGTDMMAMQVEQINRRVKNYEKQIDQLKQQIRMYQDRVERTPQVELDLTKLLRDYQSVQGRYAGLLGKKLDAQMAEELERRQKGEQFRVLDPAVPPDKPVKPDLRKIMAMALIAGLGLGGGLAYLREILDPRFYMPQEVESQLRTEVLVSIPDLDAERKKRPKKQRKAVGG